jgi:hypothetical protein
MSVILSPSKDQFPCLPSFADSAPLRETLPNPSTSSISYLGFYSEENVTNVSNLTLVDDSAGGAVPEPSTWALVGFGLLAPVIHQPPAFSSSFPKQLPSAGVWERTCRGNSIADLLLVPKTTTLRRSLGTQLPRQLHCRSSPRSQNNCPPQEFGNAIPEATPLPIFSSFPNSIWERTCPRNFVASAL